MSGENEYIRALKVSDTLAVSVMDAAPETIKAIEKFLSQLHPVEEAEVLPAIAQLVDSRIASLGELAMIQPH